MRILSKLIAFLSVIGILLLSSGAICFSQVVLAQVIEAPSSIQEAKEMGESLLPLVPGVLKSLWQEILGVWKWFFTTLKGLWDKYIFPAFNNSLFHKIENRAPLIKEEFQKEKTEIKEEVPHVGEDIWQQIKGFMK